MPHTRNSKNAGKHGFYAPRAQMPCERGATKTRDAHAHLQPSNTVETESLEALNALSLSVDKAAREFQPSATDVVGKGLRELWGNAGELELNVKKD